MKIDDYRLLTTLDETRTLRKAAERLYISQPAVTQRLKSIERHFGVDIFIRTKKQLITTTEGAMVIEHARTMLKQERLFQDKIKAHVGAINGTLSIGCSSLIGQTVMPEVLSRYTEEYPNVEIQLQVGSSEHIKAHHNDYHMMIVRGNQLLNMHNDHLMDDKHYFIYPKNKENVLHKLPFIEFQADPVYINQIKTWYRHHMSQDYHARIKVDQVATCKALLLTGVGVTILPEIMVKDLDSEQFTMLKVDIEEQSLIRSTYLSYDMSMLQLPQVSSFISILKAFVQSNDHNYGL
ncbi:LysR family transcriptional regulator [Staphylococcus felis]|uniref:LysR family transcriptional regulator n=1 Tax=Staphylococcus felis TaxID=46127 RepID=A0AAQ0HPX3_9STAP|nr:LysR family transcriptional regulator [Staphylococcus felis]AVP35679.1 LysR family transcriptional regulator [Staphylococcus felis]MBH9580795.1 LysR family transcriptional regulator [Staphylococcus felis]MDM8327019.1 LysR family transcriptional regulator [Staphylococcus felis]MDQ7192528.1 LysR family transcriptional regulator [Staphylococcus felis]PNZ37998.1 LysR family transcriptional regulator [Staphylococcus felis]